MNLEPTRGMCPLCSVNVSGVRDTLSRSNVFLPRRGPEHAAMCANYKAPPGPEVTAEGTAMANLQFALYQISTRERNEIARQIAPWLDVVEAIGRLLVAQGVSK